MERLLEKYKVLIEKYSNKSTLTETDIENIYKMREELNNIGILPDSFKTHYHMLTTLVFKIYETTQEKVPSEHITYVRKHSDILSAILMIKGIEETKESLLNNNRNKFYFTSDDSYMFNCIFHSGKKPAMIVNQRKQLYHCTSCNEFGNIFNLLTHYYHISFKEAVNTVAAAFMISLPDVRVTKLSQELRNIFLSNEYEEILSKRKEREENRNVEFLDFTKELRSRVRNNIWDESLISKEKSL